MNSSRPFLRPPALQTGLTLVELMVAMTLGLLITMVAAGALLVARQGFTSVDAAAQLRDNGRYIQDIVYRLGIQAGYKNVFFMKAVTASSSGLSTAPPSPCLRFQQCQTHWNSSMG